MYPDVKGDWGWVDATKYFCYACQHTFSVKFVLANTAKNTQTPEHKQCCLS